MAEDAGQKTHAPTEKRLAKARDKGDVAIAAEVRHAAMLAGALGMLLLVGGWTLHGIARLSAGLWGGADGWRVEADGAQGWTTGLLLATARVLGPAFLILLLAAALLPFLQGRPSLSASRIAPKWSKLSPVAGAKRLLGGRAWLEFGKTLVKLALVAWLAFVVVSPKLAGLPGLVGAHPARAGQAAAGLAVDLLQALAVLTAALAALDWGYGQWSHRRKLRMSLQELKDEHKEDEGDPLIKAKVRQIQAERSRRRMMAAVPGAAVVITNPTHYAVALRYDHGKMGAPVVVAKGVDAVAMKIKEVAGAAGVPLVENVALARGLHAAVEIDHPIPAEYFTAVAEIIGYVMRLAKQAR